MDLSIPMLVFAGLGLGFVLYLALVLRGSSEDFSVPRRMVPPGEPMGRKNREVAVAEAALQEQQEIQIRPPVGAVAAGTDSRGRGLGSVDSGETLGLLRVLEGQSDIQRQAACQALALPFAGTCEPEVADALARLVGSEDATTSVRAEAWIALRAVMGEELSWEDEVSVRHSFPAGLDEEWLAQLLG